MNIYLLQNEERRGIKETLVFEMQKKKRRRKKRICTIYYQNCFHM